MPELDLSNAQQLRVANSDVLELRIANQTVWRKPTHFWSEYPATPPSTDTNSGSLTLATVLRPTVSGVVTHIRFPIPDQYVSTTVTAGLYLREDYPGTAIDGMEIDTVIPAQYQATTAITNTDIGQWKYIQLPTPRHVNAGEYMLVAAKFHSEGVNTAYFFNTVDNYFNSDITNADGILVGPRSGDVPVNVLDGSTVNGRFSSPYNTGWPRYIYAARGYHIDVSFIPDA